MSLIKLKLPPGVYKNGTAYEAQGRWQDSNMMRWIDGTMRPIGGWIYANGEFLDGPGRGITAWRTDGSAPQGAIGTPDKLWAFDGDTLSDITPADFTLGNVDTLIAVGFGSGNYNDGVYGTSAGGVASVATTWSLDHFGEHLVACASHSRTIYEWTLDTGVLPTAIAGAPAANSVFVTPERFLVALGAGGNPRVVQWPDQENTTDWTPSALNQAGQQELQTNGIILRGVNVRGQSLVLTSDDVWTMRYLGSPYVYGFQQAGTRCGLVGPLAVQVANGGAIWMGLNNFYQFDGSSVRPIPCDIVDWVFNDINLGERSKFCSGHNSAFSEVYFWWCSADSAVIDRGCVWNYAENHWAPHRTPFLRSCWVDAGIFNWPLACSDTGRVYYHENGWTANGSPRTSQVFAQSGPVEIGNGDKTMMVRQVIPDQVTDGAWAVSFGARFTPQGTETLSGTLTLTPYTDVRLTGRQLTIQIEGATDADNRVGIFRVDGVPGSER